MKKPYHLIFKLSAYVKLFRKIFYNQVHGAYLKKYQLVRITISIHKHANHIDDES